MFSSENKWVDLHNHNKTVQEVVQIFLDYITRPPRFQDTTNMSRQAAGCDVLADCHCVPSFFFMGWGSAMMQLSNQVIGDIKVTKILQHYAKSDWGRTWKINIFLLGMPFLRDICQRIRLGQWWKELENVSFVFPDKPHLWKDFFQECNNVVDASLLERWNCISWDKYFRTLLETSNSYPTLFKLGTFIWVSWVLYRILNNSC